MRIFVTGSSGWIGSAVVAELLGAGHEVVGLARSEVSAAALENAGVIVTRGDLDDVDGLAEAAADSDGVIHLAFQHEVAWGGDFAAAAAAAAAADRRAVEAMGAAPAGSVLHAVADEGVAFRDIAGSIGRHLDVPAVSVTAAEAVDHFSPLGHFVGVDCPASATVTRDLLSWEPVGPSLLEDLEEDHYYRQA